MNAVAADPPPSFVRRNYGQGHGYTADGVKVPGVTTIIDAGIPKGGLIKWAGDEVAEYVAELLEWRDGHLYADELLAEVRRIAKYPIPKGGYPRTKFMKELSFAPTRAKEAGGLRGTQVHAIAKILAETGEWTPGPDEEHLEGYGDALEAWWHTWNPGGLPATENAASYGSVLVERPVLNREAFYAGTFDLLATLLDPQTASFCLVCARPGCLGRCLVDYKAGRSGIFGETALQLAAYRYAEIYLDHDLIERPMPEVDHCLGVWLQGDGLHETRPFTAGPEQFRTFRYVYETAKFLAAPDLFKYEGDPPVREVRGLPIRPKEKAA